MTQVAFLQALTYLTSSDIMRYSGSNPVVPPIPHMWCLPDGRVQVEHHVQLHCRLRPAGDYVFGRTSQEERDTFVEYVIFPGLILDSDGHLD